MPHSKTSLAYQVRGLKPKPLRELEDRLVPIVRRVFDYVIPGRCFFPYARYSAEAVTQLLIYLSPVLLITVTTAIAIFGASTITNHVTTTTTTIQSSPLLLAGGAVSLYSLALLKYRPTDRNDYTGTRTPTSPEEWEMLLGALAAAFFPTSFFLLHWYPEATIILSVTGQPPLVLSILAGLLGKLGVFVWFNHRYTYPNTRVSAEKASLIGGYMFSIPVWTIYLTLITFNIDILVFGPAHRPELAAFYLLVFWSAFTVRRLRWTVYEDWAGFRTIHPFIPLWGVPRLPWLFTIVALWLGSGLTDVVIAGAFAPFVGAIAYIGWRLWETADLKVHPNGGPGAGRKTYRRVQKENNEKMKEIYKLRDAVEEFNSFATEHGLDTLPDGQGLTKYNPNEIRDTLNDIDKRQARALSGDTFTCYAERRDKVRNQITSESNSR